MSEYNPLQAQQEELANISVLLGAVGQISQSRLQGHDAAGMRYGLNEANQCFMLLRVSADLAGLPIPKVSDRLASQVNPTKPRGTLSEVKNEMLRLKPKRPQATANVDASYFYLLALSAAEESISQARSAFEGKSKIDLLEIRTRLEELKKGSALFGRQYKAVCKNMKNDPQYVCVMSFIEHLVGLSVRYTTLATGGNTAVLRRSNWTDMQKRKAQNDETSGAIEVIQYEYGSMNKEYGAATKKAIEVCDTLLTSVKTGAELGDLLSALKAIELSAMLLARLDKQLKA